MIPFFGQIIQLIFHVDDIVDARLMMMFHIISITIIIIIAID